MIQCDGVMTWVEFRYERVHKVSKRWGLIGNFAPHYLHQNSDIERMINDQMEAIQRRFDYDTGYNLNEILFTNNLRVFFFSIGVQGDQQVLSLETETRTTFRHRQCTKP